MDAIMSFYSVLAIVLYSSICEALVPDFPQATQIQDPLFNPIGFSPKPTAAPKTPRDLFYKRDFLSNSASFVLVAPDQTCGYVSGLPGANFECGASTNCVFFPVTGSSSYGAVGCCTDPLSCGFRTACVDSSAFYGSGCSGGCQLDVYTMKCTESSLPYCGSIRYAVPGASVEQYFCNAEATSTWQTAFTTFSGESATRSFQSIARAVLESSAASASSTSSSSSSSSISSSSSSAASSTSSSTFTNSATSAPTSSSSNSKKSSNTGAIVGGLIGGAAVLGLFGSGAFLIYKRKYARRDISSPSQTPLNNLDPNKMGGAWPQDGFHSPQNQPQPYLSSFQSQYHPVPAEMPSDFVQRPPEERVYEKSAMTPTTATMSTPMNQHYMTPALYDRPISEIDSSSANNR